MTQDTSFVSWTFVLWKVYPKFKLLMIHTVVSEAISFRAQVLDQPADQPSGCQRLAEQYSHRYEPHCCLVVVGIAASPTFMLVDEINTSEAADLNSFLKTLAE